LGFSPTDILSVNPNLPPALVAFLDKALSKNPDERYQTGEEFGAELRATQSGTAAQNPAAKAAAGSSGVDIEI
jgi:serine/threonine protein kinase